MENTKKLLGTYVGFLRSLYLLHQNHHWQTSGGDFYGNHQLFQKIYESAQGNADHAAEKTIGLCGCDCIDLLPQSAIMKTVLSKYAVNSESCDANTYIESSLKAEKDFLDFSQKMYDSIKSSGDMTLGLDDLIMSISNEREGAVYLLQQVLLNNKFKM